MNKNSQPTWRYAARAVATALALSACTSADSPPTTDKNPALSREDRMILQQRQLNPKLKTLQPVNTQESRTVTGAVPQDLIDKMRDHLADHLGHDKVTINTAQSVTWPNGAMGCPKPGMMYTQQLIPGYFVEFSADEKVWRYHAANNGHFFLCESSAGPTAGYPAE